MNDSRQSRVPTVAAVVIAFFATVAPLAAQTDYYNTDRGRPVQIEDAYAAERYALELKLAPVRLERAAGGVYHWGIEPEIAFGFLPRTHIEFGVPLSFTESSAGKQSGVGGIEMSLFHNLNAETAGLPALGLRADVLAPVGSLAADGWYTSFTGIATRTMPWARVHVNGQYTLGEDIVAGGSAIEASRWLAGLAVDKAFPLRSMLLTVEGFARKPLIAAEPDAEFTAGAGVRYQLSPTLAIDGGAGRRLNGGDQGWYVTFGTAYAFGLRSLFPSGR